MVKVAVVVWTVVMVSGIMAALVVVMVVVGDGGRS